jgi:hypothetical protein
MGLSKRKAERAILFNSRGYEILAVFRRVFLPNYFD